MKKIITISLITSALLSSEVVFDNVVVTATKVSQELNDTVASAQVITKDEIEERRYTSVVDALNSLAGVGFTQEGGLGGLTKLYVRGVGGGRVLVLVNGVRFQDPSSKYGADFSRLILANIERIELISGAQSGIWGSDASAGVINIITTQATDGFHAGFNLEYGSFNTKEIGVFASYKNKKYDTKLSITNYITDGYSAQSPYGSDLDNYEDDYYKNRTIELSAGYNITDNDRVSAKFINIDIKNNNDTYSVGNNTQNKDMRVENQTNLLNIAYTKKLSNHKLSLRYNFAKFEKDELDITSGIKNYDGKTDEIELHDIISYREKDFILVGASYKKDDINTIKVDNTEYEHDVNSNAFFLTNTNFIDKFVITESLRRDDYSNFGKKTTGKLGIKYSINKDLSFSSNYATGYNAPSIIMILNPNGKENQDLEAEDTKSFDITAKYRWFSLTYFHNKVENLISYNKKTKQHINIDGTSTFRGFEFKYNQTIMDDLFVNFSYTRLSAKDKNGIDLRRRVKDTYKFSTDYYVNDDLHLNLNGEYLGERYDDMLSVKDPSKTKGRQTGKYLVMNFVTNYDITNKVSTYLKVNNILDKYYQVVDGYSTSPRAFYIGLNAKF
ncbi:MAG: TonB-dependent receptor [Epsilonproteobacteria bacterium]|nr:TonB-dependent receptor [Campylobacterota bacterium]